MRPPTRLRSCQNYGNKGLRTEIPLQLLLNLLYVAMFYSTNLASCFETRAFLMTKHIDDRIRVPEGFRRRDKMRDQSRD
jgi:hypothetical protein